MSIAGDLDDDGRPDITIDGDGRSRVMDAAGAPTLEGLVITGGQVPGTAPSPTARPAVVVGSELGWGVFRRSRRGGRASGHPPCTRPDRAARGRPSSRASVFAPPAHHLRAGRRPSRPAPPGSARP